MQVDEGWVASIRIQGPVRMRSLHKNRTCTGDPGGSRTPNPQIQLRYRVDTDMLAQVYDNEAEWSKVQDAIRVAQLALQTKKTPLESGIVEMRSSSPPRAAHGTNHEVRARSSVGQRWGSPLLRRVCV